MKASLNEVWDAFVNPNKIEEWGGGPAQMHETQDKDFSLWGGDIFGKNIIVKRFERIEQEWYGGEWKEPSIVKIIFTENLDGVEVKLIHENIPDDEYEDIHEGWDEYYLGAIKELVERKVPVAN